MLILGLAVAIQRESLAVRDSTCYTMRCRNETTLSGASSLLPQLIVGADPALETPVEVPGMPVEEESKLTETDLYEDDGIRYLTIAPRILDLKTVSDRLDDLESALRDVLIEEDATELSRAEIRAKLGIDE